VDDQRSPLLGSLTIAVAASLFGMLGVLSRQAYELGMEPFGFVAWRAGVGGLVIAVYVGWGLRGGARLVGWRFLDGRGRASLAVAGLSGATLNIAMFFAFQRIPVAIVLLCFYLYPAIVAATSGLLGWEPMDRPRILALGLALAGMVAVVAGGRGSGTAAPLDLSGVALALSAAVSQSVFVLVSRGFRSVPTDQAMSVLLTTAAVVAGALALAAGGPSTLTRPLSAPPLLVLLLFAGVFSAAVPSFLFLAGIRWIGPVRAGVLMLIEPLVGVVLAAAFLAEAIGPVQAAGGLAILAAAVIIQRARPAEPVLVPAGEPEPVAGLGPGRELQPAAEAATAVELGPATEPGRDDVPQPDVTLGAGVALGADAAPGLHEEAVRS
jgi:drug/metabolite transporter, DME family